MEGAVELAEEIFHMPVRLALPQGVRGMESLLKNPVYATGIGLLHYAKSEQKPTAKEIVPEMREKRLERPQVGDFMSRVKDWFKRHF